jgi:hypothetical protein
MTNVVNKRQKVGESYQKTKLFPFSRKQKKKEYSTRIRPFRRHFCWFFGVLQVKVVLKFEVRENKKKLEGPEENHFFEMEGLTEKNLIRWKKSRRNTKITDDIKVTKTLTKESNKIDETIASLKEHLNEFEEGTTKLIENCVECHKAMKDCWIAVLCKKEHQPRQEWNRSERMARGSIAIHERCLTDVTTATTHHSLVRLSTCHHPSPSNAKYKYLNESALLDTVFQDGI